MWPSVVCPTRREWSRSDRNEQYRCILQGCAAQLFDFRNKFALSKHKQERATQLDQFPQKQNTYNVICLVVSWNKGGCDHWGPPLSHRQSNDVGPSISSQRLLVIGAMVEMHDVWWCSLAYLLRDIQYDMGLNISCWVSTAILSVGN